MLDTLVTDRTEADVRNKTPKGFYNESDLNRVGAAICFLAPALERFGIVLPELPKADWEECDIPTVSDMEPFNLFLRGVANTFDLPEDWNFPTTMNRLNWKKANAIEKAIAHIITQMEKDTASFVSDREAFCGGDE